MSIELYLDVNAPSTLFYKIKDRYYDAGTLTYQGLESDLPYQTEKNSTLTKDPLETQLSAEALPLKKLTNITPDFIAKMTSSPAFILLDNQWIICTSSNGQLNIILSSTASLDRTQSIQSITLFKISDDFSSTSDPLPRKAFPNFNDDLYFMLVDIMNNGGTLNDTEYGLEPGTQ